MVGPGTGEGTGGWACTSKKGDPSCFPPGCQSAFLVFPGTQVLIESLKVYQTYDWGMCVQYQELETNCDFEHSRFCAELEFYRMPNCPPGDVFDKKKIAYVDSCDTTRH
jgi:hypothetical protein